MNSAGETWSDCGHAEPVRFLASVQRHPTMSPGSSRHQKRVPLRCSRSLCFRRRHILMIVLYTHENDDPRPRYTFGGTVLYHGFRMLCTVPAWLPACRPNRLRPKLTRLIPICYSVRLWSSRCARTELCRLDCKDPTTPVCTAGALSKRCRAT